MTDRSVRPEQKELCWTKPRTSTSLCRPWATSSLRWPRARSVTGVEPLGHGLLRLVLVFLTSLDLFWQGCVAECRPALSSGLCAADSFLAVLQSWLLKLAPFFLLLVLVSYLVCSEWFCRSVAADTKVGCERRCVALLERESTHCPE